MAKVSVFLDVAYDGSRFNGFARQPGQLTVQGALEEALSVVMARPVSIVGAGRTDARVHATGQVVSFAADTDELPDAAVIARWADALLPPAIVVSRARLAVSVADARFSAQARSYRYRIAAGRVRPVLARGLVWWMPLTLDVDAMRAGGALLVGEHDFRSFCVTTSGVGRSTVRGIDRLDLVEEDLAGYPVISVEVEGRSFLHSMVRIVVGTLVKVGRGARPPEWVAEALEARARAAAGPTAPPQGLVLEEVRYPDSIFLEDARARRTGHGPGG
jgi:tRNA pseudouridine38-40 synthase